MGGCVHVRGGVGGWVGPSMHARMHACMAARAFVDPTTIGMILRLVVAISVHHVECRRAGVGRLPDGGCLARGYGVSRGEWLFSSELVAREPLGPGPSVERDVLHARFHCRSDDTISGRLLACHYAVAHSNHHR